MHIQFQFLVVILSYCARINGETVNEMKEHIGEYLGMEFYEEQDPNYPYDEIRKYLQEHKVLADFFTTSRSSIVNRAGGPTDEGERICKIIQYKALYPQRMMNVNKEWRTIINIRNEYQQGIEVKICAGEMWNGMATLAFGFTSYCVQEYSFRELLVYNASTIFDEFRFPSCCVCKVKQV